MYKTLLGTESAEPFAEPYITSFCTATGGIAQHGLLSQWRGYGQEGGYAIVFDTSKLDRLIIEEGQKWGPFYYLFGGNVSYSSDLPDKIREELGEDMDKLQESIALWIEAKLNSKFLEGTYDPFIRCACRYKDGGFHEENEVRIVAIPPNKNVLAEAKAIGHLPSEKPRKVFFRGGTPVPYLQLFDGLTQLPEKPLPIKRIIVGPHQDKNKRRRAVEILLDQFGLDIPVSVSGIPYMGHSA